MAEVETTHILAGLGGSGATGLVMYFLKDFFSSTKKELKASTEALMSIRETLAEFKAEIRAEIKAATKDLSRVEGAIENQQKQISEAIKEMAGLTANIKALWAALQRIHPTVIKRRASDGGE